AVRRARLEASVARGAKQAAIDVANDRRPLLVGHLIEVLADFEAQQLGKRVRHEVVLHVEVRTTCLAARLPMRRHRRTDDAATDSTRSLNLAGHGERTMARLHDPHKGWRL